MVRESLQASLKTFCTHKFLPNTIKWFLQHLHYVASAFRLYVGRYVKYVNPTPPLLNSSEIGAVFDSQPSEISEPFDKWENRGYHGYL